MAPLAQRNVSPSLTAGARDLAASLRVADARSASASQGFNQTVLTAIGGRPRRVLRPTDQELQVFSASSSSELPRTPTAPIPHPRLSRPIAASSASGLDRTSTRAPLQVSSSVVDLSDEAKLTRVATLIAETSLKSGQPQVYFLGGHDPETITDQERDEFKAKLIRYVGFQIQFLAESGGICREFKDAQGNVTGICIYELPEGSQTGASLGGSVPSSVLTRSSTVRSQIDAAQRRASLALAVSPASLGGLAVSPASLPGLVSHVRRASHLSLGSPRIQPRRPSLGSLNVPQSENGDDFSAVSSVMPPDDQLQQLMANLESVFGKERVDQFNEICAPLEPFILDAVDSKTMSIEYHYASPDHIGSGIGREMVHQILSERNAEDDESVACVTYKNPGFWNGIGMVQVPGGVVQVPATGSLKEFAMTVHKGRIADVLSILNQSRA
ncbi:MAG TPA: hypothetical protein VF169_15770 [Albitalea sp.]|uniref:hypothetical protein n=1 Tax=Piscinibacter sp. TaxID=1903157 RepID=UPI002ECFEF76